MAKPSAFADVAKDLIRVDKKIITRGWMDIQNRTSPYQVGVVEAGHKLGLVIYSIRAGPMSYAQMQFASNAEKARGRSFWTGLWPCFALLRCTCCLAGDARKVTWSDFRQSA